MNLDRTRILQYFQLHRPNQRVDHEKSPFHFQDFRKAAVLVGFVERQSGLQVIFTRRPMHLKHHPGQICFPGGKYESQDRSLYQTAIREAREEVGIQQHHIEVIGHLPELRTVSRFAVTPVIAFISPRYTPVRQQEEVEEVFEIPASYVLNPRHLHCSDFIFAEKHHRVVALNYRQYFIWGATAKMIEQLQQHLLPEHHQHTTPSHKSPYQLQVDKITNKHFNQSMNSPMIPGK
ncbi:putative NUDIX hydrolase [Vibrio aerogenes CECT 7868]|uniref:Putative NUDIX hydrolase n=2 Tax=Vibrio aerogenes TaxID=92172 RepID=A0A1M5XQB7_9VIBR|nr:putative NUDIX hydrolase [Vibrio aerogenes CECT 7868]